MVHISYGMRKHPTALRSECAILAGWRVPRCRLGDAVGVLRRDYDRIRDTMAKALVGFEDFNRRVRLPLGFRIRQPARNGCSHPERRAEFPVPPLPRSCPGGQAHVCPHALATTSEYHDLLRRRPLPR